MSRPPIDPFSSMAKALDASLQAASLRLHRCAEALQATLPSDGVLFSRKMPRKGGAPLSVLFTWPGVLKTLDPVDGEIIREAKAADMRDEMPTAARFMARRVNGKPLKAVTFQPPQGQRLRVGIWADGVVRVHAVKGGELLAESEPGEPYTLRAGFHSLAAQDLAPRID